MELKSVLCIFYLLLNIVCAFNFFPEHAQVFFDNNLGSYFGYSLLLQAGHSGSPSRLIVGSPKSNSTYSLHNGIKNPGALYSCPINESDCKQFLLDSNGNVQQKLNGQSFYHRKDDGWLGAAIDGDDTVNGLLVTCAPRWINQIHYDRYYLQNGLCYLLTDSRNEEKTAKPLIPLLNHERQGFIRPSETVYYYALGEAGMSVHLAKNKSEILFGAPGLLQWKGMIGKYFDQYATQLDVPNPDQISRIDDFSYFGYTIASGKFKKSSNQIWYVGGAPRGKNLFGQVLVFEYGTKKDDLKIHFEMLGQQEGEYFGSALAVGDINNDGADDILVGSPMYSTPTHYDVGCVYLFMNNQEGIFERTVINAPSQTNAIRFGSAISVIGDINKDGYSDVAIGAPYYNDGQGAIFIYLGTKNGITEQYSQRILASEVSENLKGFGSSFSRGIDIDNNNYNDLAVGAYLSSQAVLLKTRPVVQIHPELLSNRKQLSIDTKSFEITACILYSGVHLPPRLKINLTLTADDFYKRVYFKFNQRTMVHTVVEAKYNEKLCQNVEIIVVNMNSDFTQPITFKLMYELIESNQEGFCSTCPVVDKNLLNYTTLSIPFETNCGSNDICEPNLKLNAKFDYHKPYLVIGEEEKIDVLVEIENFGEPAFACKFYAEIPAISSFIKLPDICQHVKDNVLLCDMGNPLRPNDSKPLILPLDVSAFGNDDRLVVNMNVTSAGAEVDNKDNIVTIEIPLKTEVQISVIGISDPEQFNFMDEEKIKQNNLTFTHQYTVQNLGPSPLNNLLLVFWIPQSFSANEDNVIQVYKPEVYSKGNSLNCTTTNPDGFYVEKPNNSPVELEADSPSPPSGVTYRRSRRSENKNEDAEDINILSIENSTILTKFQKLIASDSEIPENLIKNKTVVMGCHLPNSSITCMEVRCVSGLLKRYSQASINFKLLADLKVLDEKRGEKDTILITSSVQPISKYIMVNRTYTHTILQGAVRKANSIQWIILGLILGIILLCLIIFGLYKAGFFKRKEHEQLMNEKEDTFGELSEQTD